MDGPQAAHGWAGMSAPLRRVSERKQPQRAANPGRNAPLFGAFPVHVSSRELLHLNPRENLGSADLP